METEPPEDFKENVKEQMKQVYKASMGPTVQSLFSDRLATAGTVVQQAMDAVASHVADETKIEALAQAALQGATFVEVRRAIMDTVDEAVQSASPVISAMVEQVKEAMVEGIREAAAEIVMERLQGLTSP